MIYLCYENFLYIKKTMQNKDKYYEKDGYGRSSGSNMPDLSMDWAGFELRQKRVGAGLGSFIF